MSIGRRTIARLVSCLFAITLPPAHAWVVGSGVALNAIAVDQGGNILGAGGGFAVVKLARDDGAMLWKFQLNSDARPDTEALGLAEDPAGDVVAVGSVHQAEILGNRVDDFVVVKLSGADGTERWRRVIDGVPRPGTVGPSHDGATSVVLEPNGDVIAAGFVEDGESSASVAVIKFSGTDGAERWHQFVHGFGCQAGAALAVTLDAAGDVIAGGFCRSSPENLALFKFGGADGVERWRRVIDVNPLEGDYAEEVEIDARGDVVAAGPSGRDGVVLKVAGQTGAEVWRRIVPGASGITDLEALELDAGGNALIAGRTDGGVRAPHRFTVLKVAGTNGEVLWSRALGRRAFALGEAAAVTLDAQGNVVAVGTTAGKGSVERVTIVSLSPKNGGVRWHKRLDESACCGAGSAAVDSDGNIIAGGRFKVARCDSRGRCK